LLSLAFTFFCIPEPKGRTFAELDILFQKKTPARQFAATPVNIYEAAVAEKYEKE
jgi:SP family general alpha glucoside:H+ symporter-like MFS transporter